MKNFTYLIVFLLSVNITLGQTPLDTAINFSVKDIHGNTIDLYDLLDQDKLVVIDFFSTSCGPCALYAPEVQASYEDFGENSGNVFFMSICWGDDNEGVAYFDSVYHITHPSVSGSQGGGNQVHSAYQIVSTPTVILVAPDREILEQYIWEPTQNNLNDIISAAGGVMVGLDDHSLIEQQTLLYPNPASKSVKIQVELKEEALAQIEIYNLPGIRVVHTSTQKLSEGSALLEADISSLPSGTYFVRLMLNNKQQSVNRLVIVN
jgi:thiol-disulfide isomerase/thioredoxin